MRPRALGGGLAVALFFASVGSAPGAFSGDGFETIDFGGTDTARGVAIQSDGKIVVAGSTTAGPSAVDFALARFKRSGNVDDSFAGDGRRTTEFGGIDEAYDVAIQSDGRIVVVGTTAAPGHDFALACYRKSGALDDSFSGNGKTRTKFGHFAYGVAIQENGRIVVAGDHGADFALARYKQNGHLDDSFSGDGKQTTSFGSNSRSSYDDAFDLAIQRNGRIVAVGQGGADGGLALARYRRNGRLDRSFAGDGKRTVEGGADVAEGVAIQENGRIVAAGSDDFSHPCCSDFAAARFREDGGLDRSFGGGIYGAGKQTTSLGAFDRAFDVAIQRNGRIVLVGETAATYPDFEFDFALVRYRRNGELDDSFSGNGKQRTSFGPGDQVAYDVAFQSRRKLIVAGVMSAGDLFDPAQDFLVARYRNNGELDD